MLLLVINREDPWHKFCSNMMHAQFMSQNSLACSITNSPLYQQALKWFNIDTLNKMLNSGNNVGHYAADGPSGVAIIFNNCIAGPDI